MKPSGRNKVVYLLIPTSNHNPTMSVMCSIRVVYLLIPTSNHNRLHVLPMSGLLYIFWFLHQTTTQGIWRWYINSCISFDSYIKPQPKPHKKGSTLSCISFDSYIKPQLKRYALLIREVVYLLIPTSNHNPFESFLSHMPVVYLLIPTSNHNLCCFFFYCCEVVYLLIPTSNHNLHDEMSMDEMVVYLLIPTSNHNFCRVNWFTDQVVYLLIPTSNHNCSNCVATCCGLYIFWFLHQTTTPLQQLKETICCISFDSYIKPQLRPFLM